MSNFELRMSNERVSVEGNSQVDTRKSLLVTQ